MTICPSNRRLLIALNCGENLARDSICKLARRLDEWKSSSDSNPILAIRLETPEADLVEARRLLESAPGLAADQITQADAAQVRIITILDSDYPDGLRALELPPPVLYVRGRIPRAPAIAIVGSRQATAPGTQAAELFGRELAASGLTIVSGFARGIDLAAHRGALSASHGRTVAVLGCGLDIDYPRGRRRIRRQLSVQGALVSEFPFGAQPRTWNFPIRNRIIAALALGVLVVQGTPRSGSLITARLALDLGRDVYAVPGSIFEQRSAGPNALIQDGALLVRHPDEIIESLPVAIRDLLEQRTDNGSVPRLEGLPGELLQAMPTGQMVTAEHLSTATATALDQTLSLLLELEMKGLVIRLPGPVFCRKP